MKIVTPVEAQLIKGGVSYNDPGMILLQQVTDFIKGAVGKPVPA